MEPILTPIEQSFWEAARSLIPELECQVWIEEYRVDFAVQRKRLVIELDGHEFHNSREQRTNDAVRQRTLERAGYSVIRFTGSEICADVQRCVNETIDRLERLPDVPESLPVRERVLYCVRMKEVVTHLLSKFERNVGDRHYQLQLHLSDHFGDLYIQRADRIVTVVFFYTPAPGQKLPDPLIHFVTVRRGGENFEEWAPIALRQLIPRKPFARINANERVVIDDFYLQREAAQYAETWAQRLRLQGWPEKAVEVPWNL